MLAGSRRPWSAASDDVITPVHHTERIIELLPGAESRDPPGLRPYGDDRAPRRSSTPVAGSLSPGCSASASTRPRLRRLRALTARRPSIRVLTAPLVFFSFPVAPVHPGRTRQPSERALVRLPPHIDVFGPLTCLHQSVHVDEKRVFPMPERPSGAPSRAISKSPSSRTPPVEGRAEEVAPRRASRPTAPPRSGGAAKSAANVATVPVAAAEPPAAPTLRAFRAAVDWPPRRPYELCRPNGLPTARSVHPVTTVRRAASTAASVRPDTRPAAMTVRRVPMTGVIDPSPMTVPTRATPRP